MCHFCHWGLNVCLINNTDIQCIIRINKKQQLTIAQNPSKTFQNQNRTTWICFETSKLLWAPVGSMLCSFCLRSDSACFRFRENHVNCDALIQKHSVEKKNCQKYVSFLSIFHSYCIEYRRLVWEKNVFPLQLKPISTTQL